MDYAIVEAPDGTQLKVRTLYDTGASDSLLDWRLAKFFQGPPVPVNITSNGINKSTATATHIGELKVIRQDGSSILMKALKADLSAPVFTLKKKAIDIPPELSQYISRSALPLPTNDVGDTRITNPVEDYNVQILLGLDNVAFMPQEIARHADDGGQVILFRSMISGMILPCGSRRTGRASTTRIEGGQISHRILEVGSTVNLRRSETKPRDSHHLFNDNRKNLSKIEKMYFSKFEDQDLVPIPSPACDSCKGCKSCGDPFKDQRKQTVIKLMDQLVTWKPGPHEDGGGYNIRLLYDQTKITRVDEGKSQALRRLMSTEKMLARPEMSQARINFNDKVAQCMKKGYLVEPKDFKGDLTGLPKAYQPYSFALKDAEILPLEEAEEESSPSNHETLGSPSKVPKMKTRPIVDASSIPLPGGESVNSAQVDLPDIHTRKIADHLLRLRSAKRFAVGDISEFFHRLHIDTTTTSLTRVLFRKGGLGNGGEIIELVSPVSGMGLKQITALAGHVRHQIAETIPEEEVGPQRDRGT